MRASGARGEAVCAVESGAVVRYDAGAGAPWVDACQVPVRLSGDEEWTFLSVPIIVHPRDPQPELRPGSITVGPGETATFDLKNMTTWQLREDWDGIVYATEHAGTAFQVTQDGSSVTVTGADRAVPGSEEVVLVSVTSHPSVTPARLILRVGAAPSTLPQGGSVVQQCSQAAGSSCTIPVIGAGGEVNPLPRTPLEVADVRSTGTCAGVGFQVASATSITATWTTDAPGATCTATFSVRDAQGRVTNAERDGRVLLDLLGYPKPPASITQTAYADGSVTLRVDPGEARLAYPALSGFVIRSGGQEVARCDADGVCPPIAAPNGEQRTYEAWAVNGVGESKGSVRTVAWAYDAPLAPTSVTAAPVVTGDGAGGIVSLVIDGIEAGETGSLEISSPAGEVVRVAVNGNQTRVEVPSYRVGSNTASLVTVTPYSRFELPPGLGGSASGAAATAQANGVGSPLSPQLTLSSVSNGDGTATITANASAVLNGDGSSLRYGIVRDGERCTVAATGSTATFSVADGDEYTYRVCVESYWGDRPYGRAETTATVRAQQSGRAPQGWTFAVDATPNVERTACRLDHPRGPHHHREDPQPQPPRVLGLERLDVGGRPEPRHPGPIRPRLVGDRHRVVDGDAARRECAVPGAGDVGGHLVRRRERPGLSRPLVQRAGRLVRRVHVRQRRAALLRRPGEAAHLRAGDVDRADRRGAGRGHRRLGELGRPGLGTRAREHDLQGRLPAEQRQPQPGPTP